MVTLFSMLTLLGAGCVGTDFYEDSARAQQPQSSPELQPGEIFIRPNDPSLPTVSADNVAIVVERIMTDQQTQMDASVAFKYADENAVLQSPGGALAKKNGIRIGLGNDNFRVSLDAALRASQSSSRETTFLTVMSGYEGSMLVGEDTYVERLAYWGRFGREVIMEQEFVGRSLVIRPRILQGGLVEVEVFPRFTERKSRRTIDVTELATKVVVRNGQSLVIGGTSTSNSDIGAALFSFSKNTGSSSMTMILTPHIGGVKIEQ